MPKTFTFITLKIFKCSQLMIECRVVAMVVKLMLYHLEMELPNVVNQTYSIKTNWIAQLSCSFQTTPYVSALKFHSKY